MRKVWEADDLKGLPDFGHYKVGRDDGEAEYGGEGVAVVAVDKHDVGATILRVRGASMAEDDGVEAGVAGGEGEFHATVEGADVVTEVALTLGVVYGNCVDGGLHGDAPRSKFRGVDVDVGPVVADVGVNGGAVRVVGGA